MLGPLQKEFPMELGGLEGLLTAAGPGSNPTPATYPLCCLEYMALYVSVPIYKAEMIVVLAARSPQRTKCREMREALRTASDLCK